MDILSIFALLFSFVFGSEKVLHLNQGQIRGSSMTSREGREFKAFQGIPYAKPPIGELRFKPPVPAGPWEGILEATTEPYMCLQKNLFVFLAQDVLTGKEDCLYLNVYTPKIPKKGENNLLPVMIWIPGGGFSSGHGGFSLYGPHFLLDKDVVVVSINYRVGPLGFLSTEDDVLPGNYGMKDQVLALKWVQNNIEKFGGNPKSVTLFGQSAGAVSVSLHLLSPMSKGLFHKAIMQSGTALVHWGVTPIGWAKRRSLALSTIIGCPSDSEEMAECLRKVPGDLLVSVHANFFEWSTYPSIMFMPSVEKCSEDSFLCKYPLLDFKQESNVPVIIGMNSGEGGLFVSRLYNALGYATSELKNQFTHYISSVLMFKYTTNPNDVPVIAEQIFDRYFPDGDIDKPLEAVKMVTGGIFLSGVIDMATNVSSPVHFYVYDHSNMVSMNKIYGLCMQSLGVSHGDEIMSIFCSEGLVVLFGEDLKVSKMMVDLWTSFAITGDVSVDGMDWPLFDKLNQKYLMINSSNPVVTEKPFIEEYKFWKSLPLLSRVKESDNLVQEPENTEKIPKTEL